MKSDDYVRTSKSSEDSDDDSSPNDGKRSGRGKKLRNLSGKGKKVQDSRSVGKGRGKGKSRISQWE